MKRFRWKDPKDLVKSREEAFYPSKMKRLWWRFSKDFINIFSRSPQDPSKSPQNQHFAIKNFMNTCRSPTVRFGAILGLPGPWCLAEFVAPVLGAALALWNTPWWTCMRKGFKQLHTTSLKSKNLKSGARARARARAVFQDCLILPGGMQRLDDHYHHRSLHLQS